MYDEEYFVALFFRHTHRIKNERMQGGHRGRVVKVADFIIALDHSIISPL